MSNRIHQKETMVAPIILASQSPRRKQLLEWAEINFEVVVADIDETYPAHLSPEAIAVHIAGNKAAAVQQKVATNGEADKLIIAADTIVVYHSEIIGKPANREEAIATLKKLSGSEHRVITGVVLLRGNQQQAFADETVVQFHELTEAQIVFYVDKYAPYDKAGAYAIQEWIGVVGIKSIQGDFYNVMGLPVSKVVQALQFYS